ncbi:MAG: glycosyltransferase [bacterium]
MKKSVFVSQPISSIDGPLKTIPVELAQKISLALLIPGHNEEIVIQDTINSAVAAGQSLENIFVVDDGSDDKTAKLAIALLGKKNVLSVKRSGKAKAIKQAISKFKIVKRYQWVHIADADSVFDKKYFSEFHKHLNPDKYVAMTGYVQALNGGIVSKFRAYEYTYGQEIMRRFQHMFGVISVIPGPTSCYRTDILDKLDFETQSLTEDFDITLQIHRNKLGAIGFIPSAKTLTQDPKDFADYFKQVSRWYRGFWQGIRDRKIGRRAQKIDVYMGYQIFEAFAYAINFFILMPIIIMTHKSGVGIAITFLLDAAITFTWGAVAAIKHRQIGIIGAFPLIYFFRLVNLFVYVRSFIEIILLRRFRNHEIGWSTAGRRYKITQGTA